MKKIKNLLVLSLVTLGLTGCTLTQKANPTTNTNNTTVTNVDTTTNNPITTTGTNPISTNTVTTPTSSTNVIVPTLTNVEPITTTGTTPVTTTTGVTPTTNTGYTTPTNNTGSNPTSSESHEAFSKTYTGYYEKMNGHLSTVSDFKSTLNSIISANLISSNYSKAWDILEEADAVDDENIECLYTGKKIGKNDHGGNVGQWNREHVWAKSHGFGNATSNYAYYDCHHLHATEVSINSDRGNMPFDDITSSSYSSDSYGNKWDGSAFEPRDEVKGDVARSMFYMVVRYESSPDLELEDKRTSTTSTAATLGKLSTLIKWAYEDPVSEFEIRRNNVVYSYQNNRNPFIDNPEYLYYLYPQESEAYGVNLYNLADYVNGSAVTPIPGPTPTTPTTPTTVPTTPTTTPTTTTTNTNTTPVINPGETVTATATSPNTRAQMDGSNQASALGLPSVFSAVGYNNGNSNNVGLYDNIRIYAGNTLNISVDSKYIITSIKIVIDQGGTNLEVSNSSSVISLSNEVYIINDNTFTLKNSASSGQVRLASIEVTYGLK